MDNAERYGSENSSVVRGTISLAEEYEIWILLTQVTEGMLKARDAELRPFGLSAIQFALLWAVETAGGSLTASELVRRLMRQPASIYQLLDRMEGQGLVRCLRSAEGRREVRVEITKKGAEAYHQARHARQVIPRILGGLTAEERDTLKTILEKLRTRVYGEVAEQPYQPVK